MKKLLNKEIKFFYDHFIDDSKNLDSLKSWAKPIIYPFWIIRSILVSLVIITHFPIFDLYYIYYDDIVSLSKEFVEKYEQMLVEFEQTRQDIKNL